MQIPSGTAVPAVGHAPGASFALAVAKKQRDATELEGRQAVELIEAATSAGTPPAAHIGRNVNVIA